MTVRPVARIGAALLAPVLALTTALGAQGARPAVPLAITGATLIDGTGAPPAPNQTIVIEGMTIAAVGSADTVRVPANARTIDAGGKFVIPGLIDGHTHWRGWTGELFLNHGVTSIIDLGSPTDWILAARDAEIGGAIRGPRIFTAADAFVTPAGGAAAARRAARALLVKGPDVLKIAGELTSEELRAVTEEAHKVDVPVIGHAGDVQAAIESGMDGVTQLRSVSRTLMTPEDQRKYRDGRLASPHAWMAADKMDALVSLMARRGTYLNPTLVAEHGAAVPQARQFETAAYDLLTRPELRYVPLTAMLSSLNAWRTLRSHSAALGSSPFAASAAPQVVEEFARGYRNAQEFMRRFAKARGRIVAGTDAGGTAAVPGLSLHQELELLVEAGLTPMQALVAATKAPAEMIKKDYKLGTLGRGKLADLVILDADPLADIRNTRTIDAVIKNGQVVDPSYHRDYHTAFSEIEGIGVSSATHPLPVVTEVVSITLNQMSQVIHDGSPFEIVVRGDGFHSASLVELNGRPLETTFVGRGELRAKIATEQIPVEGTYAVTVFTPWPGGGRSNVKALSVK